MTVKVKYRNKVSGKIFEILFGDSYKDWQTQKVEYERLYKDEEEIEITKSNTKWIGWGGLKWCEYKDLQEQLNREGCQDKDPDNLNPRKVEDFIFY